MGDIEDLFAASLFIGVISYFVLGWGLIGFVIGFVSPFVLYILIILIFEGDPDGYNHISERKEYSLGSSELKDLEVESDIDSYVSKHKELGYKEPSFTEKKVLRELNKLGIYPEIQYKISNIHVDFAFPEKKIAIEIDGPGHRTEEGKRRDGNRDDFLQTSGWKVRRYTEKEVDESPQWVAKKIIDFLNRN